MLHIFLKIAPETVKADLKKWDSRLTEIIEHTQKLRETVPSERSPEVSAQIAHLSMLQAYEVSRHSNFLPEQITFQAAFAAERICEEALMAANSKGKLAEISKELEDIEIKYGLGEDEYWPLGEGPDDYQELTRQSEELFDKIHDTYFTHILRKYLLVEIAEQFENDRVAFEIDREVGRRLAFPKEQDEKSDQIFAGMHGQSALDRMYERLTELRQRSA